MSLARLVVTAVRVEGRTKGEVARDYGVSPRWVYELCRRFDAGGEAGLEPRSRRPRRSPQRTSEVLEGEIVALRKELADQDAAEVVAGLRVERLEESTEIAFLVDEIGQLRTPSLITVPRGATLPDVRRQGGHRWDHVQARSLGWPWVHPG